MSEKPRPWQVLHRETIYESSWVRLHRDDVRLPDGSIIEGYHVIEYPRPAVGVVPVGDDGRVLLIEHYRFVTDTTGWEVPAGRVDELEELEHAAARELREETGYTAQRLECLGRYHPVNGSANQTFYVYLGHGLQRAGEPTDTNEIMRVAWFSLDEIWAMIDANEIRDGLSLTALLWYLARAGRDGVTR
jgi:8-oxo-dGTP pyrophosphatase MutT (NUDIX family)